MNEHLQKQTKWLTVVRLSAYAPDLNPAEGLWANIHCQELANRCVDDLAGMVQ